MTKNIKCYFCNTLHLSYSDNSHRCDECSKGNIEVMISTHSNCDIRFAHILVKRSKHKYQIRLHIDENCTHINEVSTNKTNLILVVPGLSINPINANKKLATYLLFS